MSKKIKPKNTISPGGKYAESVKVALEGTMLGKDVQSFEELLLKAFGQVVYGGDFCSSVKNMNNAKNKTKNSLFNVLDKGLSSINTALSSLQNTINVQTKLIKSLPKEILTEFSSADKGIKVVMAAMPQTQLEKTETELDIIIDGKSDQLNALNELGKKYENINKLSSAIETLINISSKSNKIDENFSGFLSFLHRLESFDLESITHNKFDKIIESFKSLDNLKSLDISFLSSLYDNLDKLTGQNIDFIRLNNIVASLENLATTSLPNLNADVLQPIANLNELLSKISTLTDGASKDITLINDLCQKISEINSLDFDNEKIAKTIEQFVSFNKLNDIDLLSFNESIIEPLVEGIQNLANLKDKANLYFLTDIRQNIDNIFDVKIDKKKIKEINESIELLTNISDLSGEDAVKVINAFSIALESLSKQSNIDLTSIDKLTDLFVKLGEIKLNPKELVDAIEILTNVNKHKLDLDIISNNIDGVTKIDELINQINSIKDVNNAGLASVGIDHIFNVISKFKLVNPQLDSVENVVESIKNVKVLIDEINSIETKDVSVKSEQIIDAIGFLELLDIRNLQQISFEGIDINREAIQNTIDSVESIQMFVDEFEKLNLKNIEVKTTSIKNVFDAISGIKIKPMNLKPIDNNIKAFKKLDKLFDRIWLINAEDANENIDLIIKCINKLFLIDVKRFEKFNLKNVIGVFKELVKVKILISKFTKIKGLDEFKDFVGQVLTNDDSILNTILISLANKGEIENKIQSLKLVSEVIKNLTLSAIAISYLGILRPLVNLGIKSLGIIVSGLIKYQDDISKIDEKKLKKSLTAVGDLTKLLIVSSLCMIFGGLMMIKYPKIIIGAFAFSLALGIFLMSVITAINIPSNWLKVTQKNLKDIAVLIVAASIVMLFGGLLMINHPNLIAASLAYAFVIGIFLFAVMSAINVPSKWLRVTQKNLKDAALLVVAASLVMIFGGILMMQYPKIIAGSFIFAATLGFFLFVTMAAINGPAALFKLTQRNLQEAAKLIVAASIVMIFGGILMNSYPELITASFKFAGTLGIFLFLCMLAINLPAKMVNGAQRDIDKMHKLIITSAAVMLIGAYFMSKDPTLSENALKFTGILAAFLFAIGGTMALLGTMAKDIDKGKKVVNKILITVGLSIAALYLLNEVMQKADINDLLIGAGIMAGIIFVFGLMAIGAGAIIGLIEPGTLALMGIASAVAIGSIALNLLGNLMQKYDFATLLTGAGTLALILGAFGLITIGLAPFALVVPFALIAVTGMLAITAGVSLMITAIAMLEPLMQKIQKIDFKKIIAAVGGYYAVALAMLPFGAPFISQVLMMASLTVSMISMSLAAIAISVQEISELKVPLYSGTKKIGYRSLNQGDFKNAANNTKLIITTLSKAIMDVYDKNPEMFKDGSYAKVVLSVSKLGKTISNIAHGVHTFASLRYATAWDKEGKAIAWSRLTTKDFDEAGKNVSQIVITLSKAIMDVYKINPNLFETPFWGGKNTFSKVLMSTSKLGKMISDISYGVQSFAQMKIPTKWKDGKPVDFEIISDKKKYFDSAAENVKAIITTLSTAIISIYGSKKELFDTPFLGGKTPFSKVLTSTSKIGEMISNISRGVQDFANFKIAKKWKDGKPIEYEVQEDPTQIFQRASKNVKQIITVLSNTMLELYKGNEEFYKNPKKGPAASVLKATTKLGSLISSIAFGVNTFASGRVPIEWDPKTGKPTQFRNMTSKDYDNAARAVKNVIETLSNGLMQFYAAHEKDGWFEGNIKKTPFYKVIKLNKELSSIISKVASGVKQLYSFQVPILDANGKDTGKKEIIGPDKMKIAGDNIALIITTIGNGIMQMYKDNAPWFKDEGNVFSKSSPFQKAIKFATGISDLISNITKGVKSLATLQIVSKCDPKTGKPIEYVKLTEDDFKDAGESIVKIVTTVAEGLMTAYDTGVKNKWFDEGKPGFFGIGGKSKISVITEAAIGMTEVISNIGQGISGIATLQIPTKYNNEGKPINFRQLKQPDFDLAATNIESIITTIGTALTTVYTNKPELFDVKDDGETVFSKILNGCSEMGNMIGNIAQGIKTFAEIDSQPLANGVKLPANIYTKAADNIEKIISKVGVAIKDAYSKNSDLFAVEKISETVTKTTLFGSKTTTVEKPSSDDPPIVKAVKACAFLGSVISGIAEGIKVYSEVDGKIDFDKAGDGIKTIVTTVGSAVAEVAKDVKGDISTLEPAMKAINLATSSVSNIAGVIEMLGRGKIIDVDKNGKPTGKDITINDTLIDKASNTIGKIVSSIGTALYDVLSPNGENKQYNVYSLFNTLKNSNELLSSIDNAIGIVYKNAKAIAYIAQGVITFEGNENVTYTKDIADSAASSIKDILLSIPNALNSAFNALTEDDSWAHNIVSINKSIKYGIELLQSTIAIGTNYIEQLNVKNLEYKSKGINVIVDNIQQIVDLAGYIASSEDLKGDFDKVSYAISNTNKTLSEVVDPVNFKSQVEELDKFVKSVNSINIEGVDSLLELIRELNNLGLNMGNMDKLANAITDKLAKELKNLSAKLDQVDKTLKADEDRKSKHKNEIKRSITEIKNLMNNNINVVVKTEEPSSVEGGSSSTGSFTTGEYGTGNNNQTNGETGGTGGGAPVSQPEKKST